MITRTYNLTDQESRKLDKYLQRTNISEDEFIRYRVKGVLSDIQLDEDIDLVIRVTLDFLELDEKLFYEGTNLKPYPAARKVISFILRHGYNCKLWDIGKKINRDHSSVLSQIRWMEERYDIQKMFPTEYKAYNFVCGKMGIKIEL